MALGSGWSISVADLPINQHLNMGQRPAGRGKNMTKSTGIVAIVGTA